MIHVDIDEIVGMFDNQIYCEKLSVKCAVPGLGWFQPLYWTPNFTSELLQNISLHCQKHL